MRRPVGRAPPPDQSAEIIEIGICLLDVSSRELRESHSLLVRPEFSTVSPFCTQLTSLTPEQVAGGMSLQAACQELEKEFLSPVRTWASWGAYDARQLQRECQAKQLRYPMSPEHLNVKSWFALQQRLPHAVGMDAALAHLGWPLEGTHHRGVDDARNIARLLAHLLG